MTYKVEIKGDNKDIQFDIEDLKELKKILEEFTKIDEAKEGKILRIRL